MKDMNIESFKVLLQWLENEERMLSPVSVETNWCQTVDTVFLTINCHGQNSVVPLVCLQGQDLSVELRFPKSRKFFETFKLFAEVGSGPSVLVRGNSVEISFQKKHSTQWENIMLCSDPLKLTDLSSSSASPSNFSSASSSLINNSPLSSPSLSAFACSSSSSKSASSSYSLNSSQSPSLQPLCPPPSPALLPTPNIRMSWVQTGKEVTVTLFIKSLSRSNVNATTNGKQLFVEIQLAHEQKYQKTWDLFASVSDVSFEVTPYKVEFLLKKVVAEDWDDLTPKILAATKRPNIIDPQKNSKEYPSSHSKNPNWEIEDSEDSKETPKDFQEVMAQLYSGADEDTRRAMIKSYQMSNGTILNTSWEQAEKTNYEEECNFFFPFILKFLLLLFLCILLFT